MTLLDTEVALAFFLQLLLGHVVGDFVLQPYWLVLAKRKGWPGLIIHVGVVTFITGILAWRSIPNWWMWILVLFIMHLFIDQFRTFVFTDNSNGKGLLLLFLDQLFHVILIGSIAWAATGWTFNSLNILLSYTTPNQYRTMAYLIGLAFLISTAPVLEAEITVAIWAAQGHEVKKTVAIGTKDRVLGSVERILGTIIILSSFGLLAPLVFLPRLALMVHDGQFQEDRTAVTTKVVTSFASAVLVGLILFNVPAPTIIS
jgi:hypothetical protein